MSQSDIHEGHMLEVDIVRVDDQKSKTGCTTRPYASLLVGTSYTVFQKGAQIGAPN